MKALVLKLQSYQTSMGAGLLLLLLMSAVRHALERQMWTHMLVQFPALLLAGALLAHGVRPAWQQRIAAWNAHGITGLVFAAAVLALSMIPRLLDLALVDLRIESLKFSALLLSGAALRISWRPAGIVVQGFFLGNVLPMMASAGWLYEEMPMRLCNAYRLDEQQWLGQTLTGIAAVIAALWLVQVGWRMNRDQQKNPGNTAG